MPSPDDDLLPSDRQSRTSGVSGRSHPEEIRGPGNTGDMLGAGAAGVLSMLRTTTDTGDIGSLSVNQGRVTHFNHQAPRRRLHVSRMSDGSTRSNKTSRIPKRYSNNSPWEGSIGNRGSISSLQTTKTLPAYYNDGLGPPPHPPPFRNLPPNPSPSPSSFDGRSYSMTQSHVQQTLAVQRSVSSLRSQQSNPRMHRQRPYPPPPRRIQPGFRPVSPALSDQYPSRPSASGSYMQRPPMTIYHNDFGYGAPPGPDMRSRYHQPMPQFSPGHVPQAMTPPMPIHGYDQAQYMYPPPLMQAHPRHAIMYPPASRQGHVATSGFPRRVFPVGIEATPPSSGPSSSAPHSSNPSTPHDPHGLNVSVEADVMLDPALAELADNDSDQMMYSSYIAYTSKTGEGVNFDNESPLFGLDAEPEAGVQQSDMPGTFPNDPDDTDLRPQDKEEISGGASGSSSVAVSPFPSPAPTQPVGGLVQRMKHLLENKTEEPPRPVSRTRTQRKDSEPRIGLPTASSNTRGRVDMNTQDGHLATGARSEGRITRELIKAMTSPSSTKLDTLHSDVTDSKRMGDSGAILQKDTSFPRSSSEYLSEPGDVVDEADRMHAQLPGEELAPAHTPQSSPGKNLTTDPAAPVASSPQHDDIRHVRLNEEFDVQAATPEHEQLPLAIEVRAIRNGEEKEVVVEIGSDDGDGEVVSDGACGVGSPVSTSASLSTPDTEALPIIRRSARYSHAGIDLDDLVDASAGVTSDIVTDIAVRFSIPRQTSMAKASVIRVASTSEHQSHSPQLHQDVHELPSTTSPRGSLYAPENVPPLQVIKQPNSNEDLPSPADGADLSSFIRRSFPRRQSALFNDKVDLKPATPDGRTEDKSLLHTSVPGRLPGVKEESQEDVANAKSKPLRGSVTSIPENALDEASITRAHLSLSEIRNLPSLNFSQMNLVDQLNAALDLDDRTTLEALRKRTSHSLASPSPMRPSSTEALRERYTSFFAKPEEFNVPTPADDSESFSVETLMANRKDEQQRRLMLGSDQDPNLDKDSANSKKQREGSLSPTQFLDVASQVERLTVPSVAGLSDRLSELLPSLKRLHLDSVIADDEAVEHTIDTIHRLGQRPTTMRSARSSGVLRSLAAIADDIATNGTHSLAVVSGGPRYNKSLPPLPKELAGDLDHSGVTITRTEERSTTGSATSRDSRHGLRRTQSENRSSTAFLLRPDIPSANQTRRSLTVSTPNSRPWNFDENYPWSSEFTLRERERESIASNLLRDAATTPSKNDRTMLSATSLGLQTDRGSDSESDQGLDPTATVTADTLTAQHTRKLSKKAASLLGSLSRRAKLSPLRPSTDSIRSARRPKTSATVLSGRSTASQVHAGDRYPSTALQAPLGYDVDEMRSYFSDEGGSRTSSALGVRRRETRSSRLKKRLSDIRFRPEIRIRPASEAHEPRPAAAPGNRDSGMGFSMHSVREVGVGSDSEVAPPPAMGFYELHGGAAQGVPGGMGRVEFRMKRLGERVRLAFARGGELLRRVSGRARRERVRREQDWVDVSGSVYSGT